MGKTLYLGLDPSRFPQRASLVHCPLIEIIPLRVAHKEIPTDPTQYTHLLFTSREAVKLWTRLSPPPWIEQPLAIGQATALLLPSHTLIAPAATQEGVAHLILSLKTPTPHILWPRSQTARPFLEEHLAPYPCKLHPLNLYETRTKKPDPLPDLEEFDEIVFTSPSCVKAFLEIFGLPPRNKQLTAIGHITQAAMTEEGLTVFAINSYVKGL